MLIWILIPMRKNLKKYLMKLDVNIMKNLFKHTLLACLTTVLFFTFVQTSNAKEIKIIRDEETERFIKEISKPIFRAAGLNHDNIQIYIINDNSLNAFVSGGQNVFIHTGLIRKYNTPDVLMGVIAHEVGHIAAGHLVAGYENYSSNVMLFSSSVVLATIAALAGAPEASQAIVMGGMQVAQQNVLKFSRTQEESADQLAINYLKAVGVSSVGLLKALEDFNDYDIQNYAIIDEYSRTHPVSSDRIQHIKSNINLGENNDRFNAKYKDRFDRIRIKLEAFLDNPTSFLKKYSLRNDNVARYGKSIAYYRIFQKEKALDEINYLVNKEPINPYFHELKGQILFELREPKRSIEPYIKANDLLKDSALIKISLANAVLALDYDKDLNSMVIKNLNQALIVENNNSLAWKLLARAYNNEGNKGLSYLSLSEYYLRKQDAKNAKKYANLAIENLNILQYITRANDIIIQADKIKER
ncbi:M48 family metalloprotease, partial [Pseudomonadota bacterium]